MYVGILFMVRTDPVEYLGCRSLERLGTFEFGYSFLYPTKFQSFPVEPILRDWIIRLYQPSFGFETMNSMGILRLLVADEERAFSQFFEHLETVLAAHPEVLLRPEILERKSEKAIPPVSALLDLVNQRPRMYLPRLTPGCLRAFLDGYRLACLDEGHFDCADLDGFDHWVRRQRGVQGMFRWENAVLSSCQGREEDAFAWSLRELKAYRESRGPLSDLKFEGQ
jgi:hypothetical protein